MGIRSRRVLGCGLWAAALFAGLISPAPVAAQCTANWISTSGGLWLDPINWEDGIPPGPADVVCITAGPGPYTVTLNEDWQIAGLIVDADGGGAAELYVHDSFSSPVILTVGAGPVQIGANGVLNLYNASMVSVGAAVLENFGEVSLQTGSVVLPVHNTAVISWRGTSMIDGALTTTVSSNIEAAYGFPAAELTITSSFDNNGLVVFSGAPNTDLIVVGTLTNNPGAQILGYLPPSKIKRQLDEAVITAEIVNSGLITSDNVPLRFEGSGVDHLNATGGIVEMVAAPTFFDLSGGTRAPSRFTNGGIIIIGSSKGAKQIESLTISGGTFSPSSGQLQGGGMLILETTTIDTGTLHNETNQVEVINSTVEGPTNIINDSVLRMSSTAVAASAAVDNHEDMYCRGVNLVTGSLSNASAATLSLVASPDSGNAELMITTGFENFGDLILDNAGPTPEWAALSVSGGPFTNRAGALLSIEGNLMSSGLPHLLNADLVNEGEVEVLSADLLVSGGNAGHQNTGSIDLVGGSVTIELSNNKDDRGTPFTNGGIIIIGSSTTFTVSDSSSAKRGTPFTNGGIIIIGSSAVGAGEQRSSATFICDGVDFSNESIGEIRGHGTLDVAAALSATNGGTLTPGSSPGVLTVVGDMQYTNTANLQVEVGGYVAGDEYDRVVYAGNVGVDGTLTVTLINAFVPVEGDEFIILTYDGWWGFFDELVLPALPEGLGWSVTGNSGQISLTVVCADGIQLRAEASADREVMSIGQAVAFTATVENLGAMDATNVVLSASLPGSLAFDAGASSPECADLGGGLVECYLFGVASATSESVTITAQAVYAEQAVSFMSVDGDQCEVLPADNAAAVDVLITAAEPCDANASGSVERDDAAVAAAFIFGLAVPGNPDCNEDGVVDAADLARIIEEVDLQSPSAAATVNRGGENR